MGFIIAGVIYVIVCLGICKLFELESFSKQALVYAVVGAIWRMIMSV